MVRINLIDPSALADQHLIAEYDEILMLLSYVKKYPEKEGIPNEYPLGKGHIKFFKDKVLYLKKRHEKIKEEMCKRKFRNSIIIDISRYEKDLVNDWQPDKDALKIIKERIIHKLRLRPDYYRYYGKKKPIGFFVSKIEKAGL